MDSNSQFLTIKRLLIPLLAHPRTAQAIKYTVYTALVINSAVYIRDDYFAMLAALPDDATVGDFLTQFVTTIDSIAWVGLVFLFELETYQLSDEKWNTWITKFIRGLRAVFYVMIAYAAYGYTAETLEYYDVHPVEGVTDLCQVADQGESLQVDVIHYVEVTSDNCATLSSGDRFYTVANEVALLDDAVLAHGRWLGWIDVLNAVVWLIVVFLIEVEVWMASAGRFSSPALQRVRVAKTLFYLVLIGNMVIWMVTQYWIYAWDAFLWIFGFWAIELNLAEWEQEEAERNQGSGTSSSTVSGLK